MRASDNLLACGCVGAAVRGQLAGGEVREGLVFVLVGAVGRVREVLPGVEQLCLGTERADAAHDHPPAVHDGFGDLCLPAVGQSASVVHAVSGMAWTARRAFLVMRIAVESSQPA